MNIRLVWKKDANFMDLGTPDGPRKASLTTVVPETGKTCTSAARYRDVGAKPKETLLYGHWPG